jgi:hypothetical protein
MTEQSDKTELNHVTTLRTGGPRLMVPMAHQNPATEKTGRSGRNQTRKCPPKDALMDSPNGRQSGATNCKPTKILVSHKVNDRAVTKKLIDLLKEHIKKIEFCVSDNIEKGTPWKDTIENNLKESSLLVLVFTDPEEDWGWCLFETGFFHGVSQVHSEKKRLIYCLHHVDSEAPSPIRDLQSIPADEDNVKKWLRGLFRHTGQEDVQFESIPDLAVKICGLFSATQTKPKPPIYCPDSIYITIDPNSLKTPDDLPSDTEITGKAEVLRDLFGTNNANTDWETVKREVDQDRDTSAANGNTLKELSRALHEVCKSKKGSCKHTPQGIFFALRGFKRYRPVVNSVRQNSKGLFDCEILLIEEAGGALQNVDKPLGALLTIMRMATRVRWEIVKRFTPDNVSALAKRDPFKLRKDLQTNLNNVFVEFEFRGSFSPENLLEAFKSEDKTELNEMGEKWPEIYRKIWQSIGLNAIETFEEVSKETMKEEDVALLKSKLEELAEMNSNFLRMAVARLKVLIDLEVPEADCDHRHAGPHT